MVNLCNQIVWDETQTESDKKSKLQDILQEYVVSSAK